MSQFKIIRNRIIELKKNPSELTQIDLSQIILNSCTLQIKKLLQLYKNLQILIMSSCQLQTLDNFPKNKVLILDLSHNELVDGCLTEISHNQNLKQLLMSFNKLKYLSSLQPIINLHSLQEIDFKKNPVANDPNYRRQIRKYAPSIKIIDCEIVDFQQQRQVNNLVGKQQSQLQSILNANEKVENNGLCELDKMENKETPRVSQQIVSQTKIKYRAFFLDIQDIDEQQDQDYKFMASNAQINNIHEIILPINELEIIGIHGKIRFQNSVNVYNKTINHCIRITKNDIQVLDPELDQPRFMTFYNFADLQQKNQDQKKSLKVQIQDWISTKGYVLVSLDQSSGDLTVKTKQP